MKLNTQTTGTESNVNSVNTEHKGYIKFKKSWLRVRDCMDGEDVIKAKKTDYLPQPAGMTGEYASAYLSYIERAHFPLITSYALQGALGIIITKMPEFNVPKELEYILKKATKDGRSLLQLFLDMIIEIFQTGRAPILVDIVGNKNEFRFVQYTAEEFINWKTSLVEDERNLILGVLKETKPSDDDIFTHDTDDLYRVLRLNEQGEYCTQLYADNNTGWSDLVVPKLRGKTIKKLPLFLAGSINNSFDMQPIPLISVANCSVQIYRKEADLANSEYLSCNPTLVMVGATNDEDLPNVVGSSVMIVLPNEAARVFYTQTDTAALSHVKDHISDLYDEAIRHGVAILDARKGVEAAESLRIRQSTQSASIYSIYLAAMNAIKQGLELMCDWGGYDKEKIILDAPSSLTQGIPDSSVLKEIVEGYGSSVIPLPVIHRYLVYSGLLDQTVGFEEYLELLAANKPPKEEETNNNSTTSKSTSTVTTTAPKASIEKKAEGAEDQT
ncbi:MAG: DUF4055 domain-containing protein [bacterium]|nr:DUF4055 domain-containing protein [bacterium]